MNIQTDIHNVNMDIHSSTHVQPLDSRNPWWETFPFVISSILSSRRRESRVLVVIPIKPHLFNFHQRVTLSTPHLAHRTLTPRKERIRYANAVRVLQLRRKAQMVSPANESAILGTMYFLRANCAQHGGGAWFAPLYEVIGLYCPPTRPAPVLTDPSTPFPTRSLSLEVSPWPLSRLPSKSAAREM